jgi:thymidylate synthase
MFVHDNGCLDCQVYQRSADLFLGVPFNIASYALLTEIFARLLGLCAGKLHMVFGDVHLYSNAIQAAVVQNQREPKNLPFVCLPSDLAFDNWGMPIDYELIQYYPYSPLYVAVAV